METLSTVNCTAFVLPYNMVDLVRACQPLRQGQICRLCGDCDECVPCPDSLEASFPPVPGWTADNCTACLDLSVEDAEVLLREGYGIMCDMSCFTGDTLNCNIFDLVRP